jgi:hypothetical protein
VTLSNFSSNAKCESGEPRGALLHRCVRRSPERVVGVARYADSQRAEGWFAEASSVVTPAPGFLETTLRSTVPEGTSLSGSDIEIREDGAESLMLSTAGDRPTSVPIEFESDVVATTNSGHFTEIAIDVYNHVVGSRIGDYALLIGHSVPRQYGAETKEGDRGRRSGAVHRAPGVRIRVTRRQYAAADCARRPDPPRRDRRDRELTWRGAVAGMRCGWVNPLPPGAWRIDATRSEGATPAEPRSANRDRATRIGTSALLGACPTTGSERTDQHRRGAVGAARNRHFDR